METTDLRLQLRQLPREREPAVDLWPGIEHALTPHARVKQTRHLLPWAIAASVLMAALLLTPTAFRSTTSSPTAGLARIEAEAMTREYQAALSMMTLPASSSSAAATLQSLDDESRRIHAAINQSPDATHLLHPLKRVYDKQLSIAQRAFFSALTTHSLTSEHS